MNDILPVVDKGQISVIQTPDTFIQQAIEKGSDVTVLSGLFDLKQRWEASEAKKAFHEAMLRFQDMKPEIEKDKKVAFGNTSYSYATLPKIENTIKEALGECKLSYRWESVSKETELGTEIGQMCVITHIMGHSEDNVMFAPYDDSGKKNKVQSMASTATYLKRYSLIGALGLTTADEDDDGQSSGDTPYVRLLDHNKAVRENLQAILALKEALAEEDYENAAMYLYEMGKDIATALWVAPTKGGIFTTQEIAQMKSNEYGAARTEYFKSKGDATA